MGDRSKSIFQLEKICTDLQIASEGLDKEQDIIDLVTSQIAVCLASIPPTLLQNPPRVLQRLHNENKGLSNQQNELISRIEESFYQVWLDKFLLFCPTRFHSPSSSLSLSVYSPIFLNFLFHVSVSYIIYSVNF